MAKTTFSKRKNGDYCRLLFDVAGERKCIGLGYANTKAAKSAFEKIASFVSDLEVCKSANQKLSLHLEKTLASYREKNPKLINQLKEKGLLVQSRRRLTVVELQEEWHQVISKTTKPRTARNYKQALQPFVDFVGKHQMVHQVTAGDVADFEADCISKGVAKTTIGNYLKRTKAAFEYAVKKEWIDRNPIIWNGRDYKMKKTAQTERLQKELVTKDSLDELLNTEMHFEWKVLLHIVRYTGCRIGEALILRWEDIDFNPEDATISFRGKDTIHSLDRADMPVRVIPMWPELKPILTKAHQIKDKKDKFVLNNILKLNEKPEFDTVNQFGEVIRRGRYSTNAYQGLKQIMKRAGLAVWPKLWHSVRDFRINEVASMEGISIHALDSWFGNTEAVRKKHYSSTKDLSQARRLVSGSQNLDSSSCSVHGETDHSSPLQPISETPDDAEQAKTLDNALKKLFQNDIVPEELLVEYIRRDSNPQPSVPKTDALSS